MDPQMVFIGSDIPRTIIIFRPLEGLAFLWSSSQISTYHDGQTLYHLTAK